MSVQDWSTNPSENDTIDGVFIGENCPAANVNDMGRRIMAAVRVMYDGIPNTANFVANTGGVFAGNPRFLDRGGYLYHNSSSNLSGRIFIQPSGGAVPSGMANGDLLLEY
ncbi:hypothetical protein M2336_001658 [Sphingobium sp. B1D7B]|uniref:hypothetical protein n=1 Tax=Sphingobium sp. B1D7B TaxID=2940578 RepID=UPI002224D1CD|nr:hypothetical protein [Sphingobium sp. B1D7B]MCW2405029.1 hypothetical protein [Sphingobium sp. B1D7B]